MDWGRKIQAVRPFISIHDLHVVFKTRHAGYPVRQGSTQCQRIRLLQWFLEGKIWCWGTQEVRGTYEWWRKGQRREGWGQRRRKQVHSTNVGRQGQSGQHLLLESPRPASLSPRPPCFFVPLHPPLKLSLIPLVFVFFWFFGGASPGRLGHQRAVTSTDTVIFWQSRVSQDCCVYSTEL